VSIVAAPITVTIGPGPRRNKPISGALATAIATLAV
jgi:hypothetical protein